MTTAGALGLFAILVVLAAVMVGSGRLENADQLASVAGVYVALVALWVTVRRSLAKAPRVPICETAWGRRRLDQDILDLLAATATSADFENQLMTRERHLGMSFTYVRQRIEAPRSEPSPDRRRDDREPFLPPDQHPRVIPVRRRLEGTLDDNRHLFLEGGPGSGKSTTARQLVLRLARGWTRAEAQARDLSGSPVLPLLVTARALAGTVGLAWTQALSQAVMADLGRLQGRPVTPALLDSAPEGVPWLIVVDGLDEVPDGERTTLIRELASWTAAADPRYRLVLTSRPLTGGAAALLGTGEVGHYTLVPFDRQMLERFARLWFTAEGVVNPHERAVRFRSEAAASGLLDVVAIPLLARIAIQVFHDGDALPRNRHDLYEQYLRYVYRFNQDRRAEEYAKLVRTVPAAVDLYGRLEELVAHLAVERVIRRTSLREAARLWLADHAIPGAGLLPLGWDTAVAGALTTTGLVTPRGGDLDFIHLTFAEHLAARVHAAALGDRFDISHPAWRRWLHRATSENYSVGLAVLTRWTRENPAGPLLDGLLNGVAGANTLATRLVAEGSDATDDQLRQCLTIVEHLVRHWPEMAPWDLLRRFPDAPRVSRWIEQMALDRSWPEPIQVELCRLRAHRDPAGRQLMTARLVELLGPGHGAQAQADAACALADVAPERTPEVVATLGGLITDPAATPSDRTTLALGMLECGEEYRQPALDVLLTVVADHHIRAGEIRPAAEALAEGSPDHRRTVVAVLESALADETVNDYDVIGLAEILAGLDARGRGLASRCLRVLAANAGNHYTRVSAAASLAQLSDVDRVVGVERLQHLARSPAVYLDGRLGAIAELRKLGGQSAASAVEEMARIVLEPGLRLAEATDLVTQAAELTDDEKSVLASSLTRIRDEAEPGSRAWSIAVVVLAQGSYEHSVEAEVALTAVVSDPAEFSDLIDVCALLKILDSDSASRLTDHLLEWARNGFVEVGQRVRLLRALSVNAPQCLDRVADIAAAMVSVFLLTADEENMLVQLRLETDSQFRSVVVIDYDKMLTPSWYVQLSPVVWRSLLMDPRHQHGMLVSAIRAMADGNVHPIRRAWLVAMLLGERVADRNLIHQSLRALASERTSTDWGRVDAAERLAEEIAGTPESGIGIATTLASDETAPVGSRVNAAIMCARKGTDRRSMIDLILGMAADPTLEASDRANAIERLSELVRSSPELPGDLIVAVADDTVDPAGAESVLAPLVRSAPGRTDLLRANALMVLRDSSRAYERRQAGLLISQLGATDEIYDSLCEQSDRDVESLIEAAETAGYIPSRDPAPVTRILWDVVERSDALPYQRIRALAAVLECSPRDRGRVAARLSGDEGPALDPLAAAETLQAAGPVHASTAARMLAAVLNDIGETSSRRCRALRALLRTGGSAQRAMAVATWARISLDPGAELKFRLSLAEAVMSFDPAWRASTVAVFRGHGRTPAEQLALAAAMLRSDPADAVTRDRLRAFAVDRTLSPRLREDAAEVLIIGTSLHREALAVALEAVQAAPMSPAEAIRVARWWCRAVPGERHKGITLLRAVAGDPDAAAVHRVLAVVALVDVGAQSAAERTHLAALLANDELPGHLRGSAGLRLASLPGPHRAEVTRQLLQLPDPGDRLSAAIALSNASDERKTAALVALRALAGDRRISAFLRVRAARALVDRGSADDRVAAVKELKAMTGVHPWVWIEAQVALYFTATAHEVPAVMWEIVRDGRAGVGERCWAAEAIAGMDGAAARHARDALLEIAESTSDARVAARLVRSACRIDRA
ncbi:hypothetical protein [Winogradskya humida]|uniref:NACHT domain-containing protein n=1 Tax=Winogradskya humida TaxID=113566 RepID=A0ABQ3ZIK4_9ACTN|nr:hypothetical protein [Actinoplanes humidus]GIE18308.1 hypothetical protein Ahu01nite_014100 [Actinoplanes humidus]